MTLREIASLYKTEVEVLIRFLSYILLIWLKQATPESVFFFSDFLVVFSSLLLLLFVVFSLLLLLSSVVFSLCFLLGSFEVCRERSSFDSSTAHGTMPLKSQHWRYSFRRCKPLMLMLMLEILVN